MNSKDLENINWIVVNGRADDRIKLLSILAQLLELTTSAMLRVDKSPDSKEEETSTESVTLHECRTLGDARSTDENQLGASNEEETSTVNSQNGQTTPTFENFANRTNTYGDDESIEVAQVPLLNSSVLGSKQTSSHQNVNIGNSKGSPISKGNNFNLSELLESDVCRDIVSYYKENGGFDEATRKKFMRIMCDELLKGEKVANADISRISSDVCLVFLTEEKMPYYNQLPGSTPTGVFYNMYRNGLKKQKPPNTTSNPRKRKAQDNNSQVETVDLDAFSGKIKESVNYFKTSQAADTSDFKTVHDHWSECYVYRRSTLRKKAYQNFMKTLDDWQILKSAFAYELISFDFKKMNGPLCSSSLLRKWNDVKRITGELRDLICEKRKEVRSALELLPSEIENYTSSDDVTLAKSLHYILPPANTSTEVKKWTPTMESSERSFYQLVKSQSQLEENIDSRKNYLQQNGIELHPIIYETTETSGNQFVVVMGDLRFTFHNFLPAFDAAFKLFIFFNIPFPRESIKFWTIVNELMYDLKSDPPATGKSHSIIQSLKFYIERSKVKSPSRRSRSRSTSPM